MNEWIDRPVLGSAIGLRRGLNRVAVVVVVVAVVVVVGVVVEEEGVDIREKNNPTLKRTRNDKCLGLSPPKEFKHPATYSILSLQQHAPLEPLPSVQPRIANLSSRTLKKKPDETRQKKNYRGKKKT